MGQGQSKSELLYQQVSNGNSDGIKKLHREGARLEWKDKKGKTPLIVACMKPGLLNVAKTLIQLGANVNAYRPGRHAGTPLHHAAKRGLESIVKLLLSHGANPLILNDDCHTALDVARAKGNSKVVRAIESHICLFSGWLREFHGLGFLEVVAPNLVSRKVWVVVLPLGSRALTRPYKLELAIYSTLQDARPRKIVALWKAKLEEPKLLEPNPSVIISDKSTKTHMKFGPASENDRQQLTWFSNACKGIPQVNPTFLTSNVATIPPTAPPTAEDPELDMAIHESLQHAIQERFRFHDASSSVGGVNAMQSFLGTTNSNTNDSGESSHQAVLGGNAQHVQNDANLAAGHTSSGLHFNPSAPPLDGPIHYPSIDLSSVDVSSPVVEKLPGDATETAGGSGSTCVICLDAPAEGACIPCGHVSGCMSCLNEVKTKKWGCPLCRAKIDQIIKLYHV